MIQKLTWLHFIGYVGCIYFIRTITTSVYPVRNQDFLAGRFTKPGYGNASALVGITICRFKAQKFAWCNTLYK